MSQQKHLEVIPLGGFGEIGKNMLVFRYEGEILVVDGGMAFPDSNQPGIDLIIPKIDYLLEHAAEIKAFLITHGHEDHIGALPYILPRLPKVPLYGAKLTLGLLREKFSEFGIPSEDLDLREMGTDDHIKICRSFSVDLFRMTHSIPDNSGFVLHTPIGKVIHSGDFKLDQNPVDGKTSHLEKISKAGAEGVMLLISDSTSVEKMGLTPSEADVALELEKIMSAAKGRVFVTTFASHIHRIQSIIRIAEKCNRRVVMEGRSMHKYAQIAQDLGYMKLQDRLISTDEFADLQASQAVFICTGSQGQPMSVLSRLALGNHPRLSIKQGDTVILSSSPIPGNEEAVNAVVNSLYLRGAKVYYPPNYKVHASGHASQEELKLIFNLAQAKWFLPFHGEPRQQINHQWLAESCPNPPKRTIIAKNGDLIHVSKDDFKVVGSVPAGAVYVDGLGVGDVNDSILEDRLSMAGDGVLVIGCVLGSHPHAEIASRGFIDANKELFEAMKEQVVSVLERGAREKKPLEQVRDDVYYVVRRFVRKATGRNPMIIPVVVD
ncbi:MAG: ribonuclease J [Deinococcales bacterium]